MKTTAANFAGALAVAITAGCSGVPTSGEAPSSRPGRVDPEWFTLAVADSRRTMEVRCADFAPLEIVMTSAPMYEACIGDASAAAIAAREAAYRDALGRCISASRAGAVAACCFPQVTDQVEVMAD